MRLIDADALIPMMKYATIDGEIGVFPIKIGFDTIVKVINAQPTVECKKGEWEETEVIPEAYDITGVKTWASKMRCNQCGFTTFAIEGKFAQYDFCPNCGVDMRTKEMDCDYERAIEQLEHNILYEPTFNQDDGSM